jgi:LysM repeat protein
MKKTWLLAITLCCSTILLAQNELVVQSNDKGLYVEHQIVPKENFYSVGRLFNVSPKDIASFNGLDMTHGLTIGQTVKIPLNERNFTQKAAKGRPLYYIVGTGEGLYKVSTRNKNVLMANLRKWNHLTNDNIATGKMLIVGYLDAPDANNIVAVAPNTATPQESQPHETGITAQAKKPVPEAQDAPVVEHKEAKPKEEVKEAVQKPEEAKPKATAVSERHPDVPGYVNQTPVAAGNPGYFKSQYELQSKSQPEKIDQTASAGIFKTASGWQDAKYYALLDHVEPGTIVKITNPTNNKSVYVKVLGEMSNVRQNQGYDLRISNAAASALQISETDKFIVRVNY